MAISWEKRQARKLQWSKQGLQDKDDGPDLILAKFAFLGSSATILMALGVVLAAVAVMLTPYLMWHYPWIMGAMLAGSVWPVASLMYLNNHNQILQHEGVVNPKAERTIAWFALFSLSFAAACAILAQHYDPKAWYAGAGMAVFAYAFVTFCTFVAFSPPLWVSKARHWFVWLGEEAVATLCIFALLVLLIFEKKENWDD